METPEKYFVKGKFVGNFTTMQQKVLTSVELFPKGDEHKVKIYRGIINKPNKSQLQILMRQKDFTILRK